MEMYYCYSCIEVRALEVLRLGIWRSIHFGSFLEIYYAYMEMEISMEKGCYVVLPK